MKSFLLSVTLAMFPLVVHAGSERTAEEVLSASQEFENKEVTLDVAFVQPVRWKSPVPELAFFHAVTMDRRDWKSGGAILVAVASEESANFAKKYGTDFEGRSETDAMKGTLLASAGSSPAIWFVDTTGKAASLVSERKVLLPQDNFAANGLGGRKNPGR